MAAKHEYDVESFELLAEIAVGGEIGVGPADFVGKLLRLRWIRGRGGRGEQENRHDRGG